MPTDPPRSPDPPPPPAATGRLVHEWFGAAARRWPDRVAVDVPPGQGRAERTRTSYAALARHADAITSGLVPLVGPDRLVGILLPRTSADLYAAQLGVLQAGAAYVCLEPAFPADRIIEILADAEVVALLTDEEGVRRAAAEGLCAGPALDVAALGRNADDVPVEAPAWLTPDSLAYLIYTSGSTGRPKGVMIEHRGVSNLIASDVAAFGIGPGDRVAQNSSAAYDSSVEEVWLALATGATLVVVDDDAVRLGPDLVSWLRDERVTVLCPPPTLLRAMACPDPQGLLPDLRFLYLGGEALPQDLSDHWARGRLLVNGYGPTECTVTCLREAVTVGEPVTIGVPIEGVQAWVLDDALAPVPDGVSGELCVGGVGLARGYWRRPELTVERFPTLPGLGRVYRTGDLTHRDADGRFHYHGRMDTQVKIRGYRVELGEIEAHLTQCDGVRVAACRLQDEGGHATLVAFVVPRDQVNPPAVEALHASLARALPAHMVPARIGVLDTLPTTLGGKLDRQKLPRLDVGAGTSTARHARVPPTTAMEVRLDAALSEVMRGRTLLSVHDDFFDDLGGDSLTAAEWVTRLRESPETAWVTVRDVYDARTIARLALRAPSPDADADVDATDGTDSATSHDPRRALPGAHPVWVACAQLAWLAVLGALSTLATWWIGVELLPLLAGRLGLTRLILLAPALSLAGAALYTWLAVLVLVVAKRLLIGRYVEGRVPVWSAAYLRHWLVQSIARLVPWSVLEGTELELVVLRRLGATIGRRVHLHHGADVRRGGWDLLTIGDDVMVSQDAQLRLVDFEARHLVTGPVTLGDGATVDVRAGLCPGTEVGPRGYLTALSWLAPGSRVPEGERWDGIPAHAAGPAPDLPPLTDEACEWSPRVHAWLMVAARSAMLGALALPAQLTLVTLSWADGLDVDALGHALDGTAGGARPLVLLAGVTVLAVPLSLAWSACLTRVLGRVAPATISRWSRAYIRVWLKAGLVRQSGDWLSGTLLWPAWLRLAGMRIGRGSEVSTIIDVVPELVSIGRGTFFADGIYLGGPRLHRGRVTLAPTSLGDRTFLGNHAVIFAGQALPDDVLLGVSTPADEDRIRPGTAWFGHPVFELPRREVVDVDRRLTHEPSAVRYWNRVAWELARFLLPLVPLASLVAWWRVVASPDVVAPWRLVLLATAAAATVPSVLLLVLKWLLLGRVRPGHHPLWSCWCSRWDFLYVAWSQWARPLLAQCEGTPLLTAYLRAIGMRIGRGVVLGPGFAQVVDPDMITIEDGATVDAMFQAHTFEDRVLKIDHVTIGAGATVGAATVPLYGARVGAGAMVAPHSVIMKREHLLPGRYHSGAPTRPLGVVR